MINTPTYNCRSLIGAGIICGLEATRKDDKGVFISPGMGLTSDGECIKVETTAEYFYYRQLKPELELELYQYFTGINTIFELLQTHQCGPESPDYRWIPQQSTQDKDFLYLNDKIIVLYLDQLRQLRALAIPRKEITRFIYGEVNWEKIPCGNEAGGEGFSLWKEESLSATDARVSNYCLYNYLHPQMNLPLLSVPRFGYGGLDLYNLSCDEDYEPVFCAGDFFNTFEQVRDEYAAIIDFALEQITAVLKDFNQLTIRWIGEDASSISNIQNKAIGKKWGNYKKLPYLSYPSADPTGTHDQSGIQYWYDFLRDLTEAWNELRNTVLKYRAEPCGTPFALHRHLLLGGLSEEKEPFYYDPFRSDFKQPPVYNSQAEILQRIRFGHWRIVMMMKSFFVPGLDWDDTAHDTYHAPLNDINMDNPQRISSHIRLPIRLKPSRGPEALLGNRAIPFYYDLANHPQSLHWYWDYDAAYQNRADFLLSYYADNDAGHVKAERGEYYAGTDADSYTKRAESIHAFAFDLRALPFIRVEGLTGKSVIRDATGQFILESKIKEENEKKLTNVLDGLKKKFNTCFDVKVMELGNADNKFPFCSKCLSHLGGTYQSGTFFIVIAPEPIKPGTRPPEMLRYKIVGDFFGYSSCDCEIENQAIAMEDFNRLKATVTDLEQRIPELETLIKTLVESIERRNP